MPEISREAFLVWADSVGVNGNEEHLELLRGDVQGMMGRLAHLDDIDTSEISVEEAGLRHDGGVA